LNANGRDSTIHIADDGIPVGSGLRLEYAYCQMRIN
jgi:hypothetical protein